MLLSSWNCPIIYLVLTVTLIRNSCQFLTLALLLCSAYSLSSFFEAYRVPAHCQHSTSCPLVFALRASANCFIQFISSVGFHVNPTLFIPGPYISYHTVLSPSQIKFLLLCSRDYAPWWEMPCCILHWEKREEDSE